MFNLIEKEKLSLFLCFENLTDLIPEHVLLCQSILLYHNLPFCYYFKKYAN